PPCTPLGSVAAVWPRSPASLEPRPPGPAPGAGSEHLEGRRPRREDERRGRLASARTRHGEEATGSEPRERVLLVRRGPGEDGPGELRGQETRVELERRGPTGLLGPCRELGLLGGGGPLGEHPRAR